MGLPCAPEEWQARELLLKLNRAYSVRKHIPRRDTITKCAKEKGILRPKYIRVFAIRQMRGFFRRTGQADIGKFILGKFSELSVTEAHYLNLLEEADGAYPELAQQIATLLVTPKSSSQNR